MRAPTEPVPPSLPPVALRVAAALCAVVGAVSSLALIPVVRGLAKGPATTWLPVVVNSGAVLSVSAATVFIWKGRRLGGYLLAAAAIVPNLLNLAYAQPLRAPGLLMVLALITVLANWKLLR